MSAKRITMEIIDKAGENRISQKSTNGNVTYASSEGYKNLSDMRKNAIDSSIALLQFYEDRLSQPQVAALIDLGYYGSLRLLNEAVDNIKKYDDGK